MNMHDTRRMEEVLHPHGYRLTHDPGEAAVVIINTCSVREKSFEKVLSAIGRLGRLKTHNPDLLLCVAGCVAQQEGTRLLDAAPMVDLVVSPDHIATLPTLIEQARARRTVQTGFVEPGRYHFLGADTALAQHAGMPRPTALVTIQKGCDNSCSYCIVPRVRGPAVSRSRAEILDEIEGLVAAGVLEVTLIGQNVNSYRGGSGREDDFVDLLRSIDEIEGLERLRFTTSHPKDVHPELATCYATLKVLCPWLHLPVQSGSTRVLQQMNRGYTRADYLGHVQRMRAACPDLTIGTDLIVGYPQESEEDFLETISLLEAIQFDYSYSFKFSVRPGTAAELLCDDVAEAEKARRLAHLQAVQDGITRSRLASWVGRVVPILIEGPSRQGLPQLCGRSPGNHVVNIDGSIGLIGTIVPVRITAAGKHSLHAEIETGQA